MNIRAQTPLASPLRARLISTARVIGLVSLLGLLLTSCASQQPLPPSEHARFEAAGTALGKAIRLDTLSEHCRSLGGRAAELAATTQRQWLSNNWALVAAADADYSATLSDQTSQYQGVDIAPAALRLLAREQARAVQDLGFNKRTQQNREFICEKLLTEFNRADSNLAQSASTEVFRDLQQRHKDLPSSHYRVPRLAGSLDPLSPVGRSYYQIERSAPADSCANAEIYTFNNQWPDEAYGVFCADQRSYLVKCEWGKCQRETMGQKQ